jgi:hypothetical protein
MKTEEKFASVKGKIPTKEDLLLWSPGKYIQFIRFCEFFIVDNKLSVTKARWRQCEEVLTMPDHPFHEFLYRINFFTFSPDANEKRFYFKLVNFIKSVLGNIQANPSIVTDEMKNVLEHNEKFKWALQQTKVVESSVGPVLAPEINQIDQGSKSTVVPDTFQHQITEAALKVVNLTRRLAESISDQDLRKLSGKDRIIALSRLSFIFSVSKNMKPGKQIFQQINIHSAQREDLESALLSVTKSE